MSGEQGYDRSRFINYNSDSFDCAICSCVARFPKECNQCGSIFCGVCIDAWFKKTSSDECINRCPKKQKMNDISKALKKIYDDLEIKCQSCSRGIRVNQIEKHELECSICTNFEYCGSQISLDNSEKVCDSSCYLLNKIKSAKERQEIYKIIQMFTKEPKIFKDNVQYQIEKPLTQISPGNLNGTIKWDKTRMGTGMELTDGDQKVFLKEQAYMFRTIIANTGFESGIVYWEIEADDRTENELKIGVTTQRDFNFDSAFCDFEYGWAYYGLAQLRHNSNATGPQFGKRFKKEGTLGICLNMNQGTLMFSLNGDFMGCAYKDEKLKTGPIYPAVALLHCAGCKITNGKPIPQIFQQ